MPEPAKTAPVVPLVIAASPIFAPTTEAEFRQGEVISNVVQYGYDASQDCDLLQDHAIIAETERSSVNGILVYEAHRSFELKATLPPGKDIWKRIWQNNDDRYHAIEAAPGAVDSLGAGLPDLIVDFRRFFTIPSLELKRQCQQQAQGAVRRCRLEMPYREHFQSRAGFYLQRVGVPSPHQLATTPPESV